MEQGLFHVALEGTFRRRMADEERDDPEYRESLEKQENLRNAVVGLMRRMELDALVYPTMRRPIARIGDRQAGSTCQLSASTGLPALSVPAGFTEDGLPFGIELLGLPFSDPHLLSLGYSFEQNTDYRRVPSYASAIGNIKLIKVSLSLSSRTLLSSRSGIVIFLMLLLTAALHMGIRLLSSSPNIIRSLTKLSAQMEFIESV